MTRSGGAKTLFLSNFIIFKNTVPDKYLIIIIKLGLRYGNNQH